VKGCDAQTPVFKFRPRSDNELRHRHAGKLYIVCPIHGRAEPQEWILANAQLKSPADARSTPAPASSSDAGDRARDRPSAPAPATASPPATKRAGTKWGFF